MKDQTPISSVFFLTSPQSRLRDGVLSQLPMPCIVFSLAEYLLFLAIVYRLYTVFSFTEYLLFLTIVYLPYAVFSLTEYQLQSSDLFTVFIPIYCTLMFSTNVV